MRYCNCSIFLFDGGDGIWKYLPFKSLLSFKLSEGLKKYLQHTDFEWTKKTLALDPQGTYFHPSSLTLLLISSYSPSFSLHSPYLFILLLSICFPFCFPAAGNRTYRLWPDGDDGQAVPAQDHHCRHQRLCPPHWLRPHQEGGQELSLCSLLSISCCLSSFDLYASRCLYFLFLILCYECQKGMKLIQSFLLKWHIQLLFSDTSHTSVQWRAEKRALTFQLHKPNL